MSIDQTKDTVLEQIADNAYAAIASSYPICSSSDEFYFFPQTILRDLDWGLWDDFSADEVTAVAERLQAYEQELEVIPSISLSPAGEVDAGILKQILKTLREQLTVIAPHKTQPTFHLTILATGLAEALETQNPEIWDARLAGVPEFLRRAGACLQDVPVHFLQLGLNMLTDVTAWVKTLQENGEGTGSILQALAEFEDLLLGIEPEEECRLSADKLDLLLRDHLQCGLGVTEIEPILKDELTAMEAVLSAETARLLPGRNWLEVVQQIPFVEAAGEGLHDLYEKELSQLKAHCQQHGLIPDAVADTALKVTSVPAYMSAIRASDAYAAIPGFPPRGGVFFVMEEDRVREGRQGRTLEYRMTAVHEVWPGHHLLDSSRWALERSLRRHVELPLFYEGWACLAEEIMAKTGYLTGPWDRFILAKRRAERAARGLVDLGLQSGTMKAAEAGELLVRVGYRIEHANKVVSKYLLRPGYQVCYTLGLIHGLQLMEQFGDSDMGTFARKLLSQGEIGFPRLKEVLSSGR